METNTGITKWLRRPRLYELFQDAIGGNKLRRWFIQSHVRAKPGDKIIDIGCGPGQIFPWLPAVNYVGLDISANYIAAANKNYGDKATFLAGDVETVWNDDRFSSADIVIGLGILHHLDDVLASRCIQFAHRCLKEGGRLVCLEACWLKDQGLVSRAIMSRDRGQHIRTQEAYRDLLLRFFGPPKMWVQLKPMRIPYVTIVFECERQ